MKDILDAARQAVEHHEPDCECSCCKPCKPVSIIFDTDKPRLLDIEFTIAKLLCIPGDTVIFKIHGVRGFSYETMYHMQTVAENMVPSGVKVFLMDADVDISILRNTEC